MDSRPNPADEPSEPAVTSRKRPKTEAERAAEEYLDRSKLRRKKLAILTEICHFFAQFPEPVTKEQVAVWFKDKRNNVSPRMDELGRRGWLIKILDEEGHEVLRDREHLWAPTEQAMDWFYGKQ